MSRKNGGIIGILNGTASGNAKGIWSLSEVHTARKDNIWPKLPGAPTIGTATAGTLGNASANITFTAPADTGFPNTITFTATSNNGISSSNTASPIAVTGLIDGINVTFTVTATNAAGAGPASAASNAITPLNIIYPTSVTYLVVAGGGAGLTGGGGAGGFRTSYGHTVSVATNYTVTVGAGGASGSSPSNDGSPSVFDTITSAGGGGGGSGVPGSTGVGGAGGVGAVRIMWGPGRSYPSTGTADQFF